MGRDRELPPPLEMICLHALWELQEGNVEDVRRLVSRKRPLAYTTVLTLLDRLARRGAVTRRREGRGFRYRPTVERERTCKLALTQFLDVHFDGSVAKLRVFLESPVLSQDEAAFPETEAAGEAVTPLRAAVAAAGMGAGVDTSFKPTL